MQGGGLYDPLTMNEVATGARKRLPYWWEGAGNSSAGVTTSIGHGGDTGGD